MRKPHRNTFLRISLFRLRQRILGCALHLDSVEQRNGALFGHAVTCARRHEVDALAVDVARCGERLGGVGALGAETDGEEPEALNAHLVACEELVAHDVGEFHKHCVNITLLHRYVLLNDVCQLLGIDDTEMIGTSVPFACVLEIRTVHLIDFVNH